MSYDTWTARVYGKDNKFIEHRDVEVECGEHFCDSCGDCLHCYGSDPCYGNLDDDGEPGLHFFVIYSDEYAEIEA